MGWRVAGLESGRVDGGCGWKVDRRIATVLHVQFFTGVLRSRSRFRFVHWCCRRTTINTSCLTSMGSIISSVLSPGSTSFQEQARRTSSQAFPDLPLTFLLPSATTLPTMSAFVKEALPGQAEHAERRFAHTLSARRGHIFPKTIT